MSESDGGADMIAERQAQLERRRAELAEQRAKKPPGAATMGDAIAGAVGRKPSGFARLLTDLQSGDPETVRRARFALADDTRRNLHRFKRRSAPSYPVRLPPESVLMQILQKRGKQRSATDKATVLVFVKWRDAVYRCEHANESTLRALFEAVRTFRALELPAFTVEILEHLELEFEVEGVPTDSRDWHLDRRTRDFSALTSNLRRGSYERRPPKRKHPEDDDTALRGDIEIPAPGSDPDDAYDVPDFP
ncbi:MAG TPA: hypothetical protein ENK57_12165 [Polyangiaceae bacterium]|nr:hypothetical protein [Polyangiaceae bacterium]